MPFGDRHTREQRFAAIGRDLFLSGAVSSHGGNLSEREGDTIWISRRGSMLGQMGEGDVIETGLREDPARDALCSRELVVHRAIYQATDAKAIVHAHTKHTVFRSMVEDVIIPPDSESNYVIGSEIAVFSPVEKIGSLEAATMLAQHFSQGATIAVLRTHGPFATGEALDEAFYRVSCLEASCELLDLRDMTRKDFL